MELTENVTLLSTRVENSREKIQPKFTVVLTEEVENAILGPKSDTRCGFWCMNWPWLQRLARADVYLVIFSLVALTQGIFFAYTTGTLTTVERRFKLPSKVSGLISTGNDFVQVIFSLHVTQIAGRGHRPRWISFGLALSIIACLFTVLPHAIFGAGEYTDITEEALLLRSLNVTDTMPENLCIPKEYSNSSAQCVRSDRFSTEQITVTALHFMGQMATGFGSMLFYTVGYTYLDEAVSKDKVPFFFAISGTMRIFGPVTGYAMSAWALNKWIDPSKTPSVSPAHPKWVGAWWLGYPLTAICLVFPMFFLMFLPHTLPSARKRSLLLLRVAAANGREEFDKFSHSVRAKDKNPFRGMEESLKRLFRNKIYMTMNMNQICFWAAMTYFMFVGKYIEQHFRKSAAEANMMIANIGLIATSLGWIAMGSVMTFLKPPTKSVLVITIFISLFMAITFLCQAGVKCHFNDLNDLKGLDLVLLEENGSSATSGRSMPTNLMPCMERCNCSRALSPVCVKDVPSDGTGETRGSKDSFYSPCHAGCSSYRLQNGSKLYFDCSCAMKLNSSLKRNNIMVTADGFCEHSCIGYTIYLSLIFLLQVLLSANRAIANIIFFRSVSERDKDLSLGLLNVFLCIILIISPLTTGAIIDWCCLLWHKTCGTKGYCYLYRLDDLRVSLHVFPAGGMVICMLTELLLLRWHNDIDLLGEKEKQRLALPKSQDSNPT